MCPYRIKALLSSFFLSPKNVNKQQNIGWYGKSMAKLITLLHLDWLFVMLDDTLRLSLIKGLWSIRFRVYVILFSMLCSIINEHDIICNWQDIQSILLFYMLLINLYCSTSFKSKSCRCYAEKNAPSNLNSWLRPCIGPQLNFLKNFHMWFDLFPKHPTITIYPNKVSRCLNNRLPYCYIFWWHPFATIMIKHIICCERINIA